MGYEFDVFLSYTRRSDAGRWVQDHFHPALRSCLDNAMPRDPSIWIDSEQDSGRAWPQNIEYTLRRSRVMVAVLSPPYFRRPWCLAEWTSMREREKLLGLGTADNPTLLVHTVRFADGDHFAEDAKDVLHKDFTPWNVPLHPDTFQRTEHYWHFYKAVEQFAIGVAKGLEHSPEWDASWPIIKPDPLPHPPRGPVPRL